MNKKGFTLLELIIVIVILGILASFAMPRYFRAAEKARAAEAVSILGAYRSAQIRERAERGVYTANCPNLDIDLGANPRYFNPPTCFAAAPGGIIASIQRNIVAVPNPVEPAVAYTLSLTDDGVFSCLPAGASCTAVMP